MTFDWPQDVLKCLASMTQYGHTVLMHAFYVIFVDFPVDDDAFYEYIMAHSSGDSDAVQYKPVNSSKCT